ncbi:MAG: polysaccharide pyruvyl transferase family protein, partial [Rikenellaceae bacterium]
MRVGILTFHRANNYGAVLQCYALQESLRGLGYDAFVIDYRQQFVEMVYKKFSWRYLFTLLRTRPLAIPIYLMNCDERGVMRPLFTEFRNKHLRLTAECHKNIPQNVDTYIIGSDQLWGNNCTGGIDPIYYGEFARTMQHKIYSYAISSYADSINKLSRSQIRNFARNFAALSFRESKIAQMVATRSKQPTRVDIDPTLLLDAEQWSGITSTRWHERRYVLLYQLRTKKGRG